MYKKQCSECGKKFESIQPNALVCSEECRKEKMRNQYGLSSSNLPSKVVGTIHEYKAYLDIYDLGVYVYSQFIPFSKYDAILLTKKGTLLKADIKTGYRSNSTGNIMCPKKHKNHITDIIIVYIKNEGKTCFFKNKKEITKEELKNL